MNTELVTIIRILATSDRAVAFKDEPYLHDYLTGLLYGIVNVSYGEGVLYLSLKDMTPHKHNERCVGICLRPTLED